jgi:hypothetical protein
VWKAGCRYATGKYNIGGVTRSSIIYRAGRFIVALAFFVAVEGGTNDGT